MRNLVSLQHLESKYFVRSPKDVGQLTSLRTLSYFSVGRKKGYHIKELGCLKHLGEKLHISNLSVVGSKEEAIQADLDILEGLQTHENVKSLTIENYSSDCFPDWVTNMSTNIGGKWVPLDKLVDVKLSLCRNVLSLPMDWKLLLLRDLVLSDMDSLTSLSSYVGLGSGEPLSLSLRKLELWGMKRLEKWRNAATNSSTMISPVLEMLLIDYCPKIIFLDEYHPYALIKLKIKNCRNLKSIRSLQGLKSLEILNINDCPSLLGIPDLHNLGGSLRELVGNWQLDREDEEDLRLRGCCHWESIPEEVQHLISLELFRIDEFGIREIPMWLTNMSSIKDISFKSCHGLDADSVFEGSAKGSR
nr:hypothetical protein [Tanacetum cinerariifolium]